MKKVAITGGNGYLGSLIRLMNKGKFEFICITLDDIDLNYPQSTKEYFEKLDFDVVFHAAANPTTDDCENKPEMTHRINTESAIEIAKVCKEKGKRFIFLSTEQVYNGKKIEGPFKEDIEIETVTNYGRQKAEVEKWLKENMDDYLVLRLASMFGMAMPMVRPSVNLISNTLNAIRNQKETLFTVNELRGMTYAQRLASQFDKLIKLPSDIYNFTAENDMNTYEIAKHIAKNFGYPEEIIHTYIKPNHDRYTDRFRDYRLDASKIKEQGIELYNFKDDLDQCLKDFGWK